jgi:hypothetical protein
VPQLVTIGTNRYLALFVPKRPDRAVNVSFGTSTDLLIWDWSAAATTLVTQDAGGLTARSASPLTAASRSFLRARYSLP